MTRMLFGALGFSMSIALALLFAPQNGSLAASELPHIVGGAPNCMWPQPSSSLPNCTACEPVSLGGGFYHSFKCDTPRDEFECVAYQTPYAHSGPDCRQNYDDCDGQLIRYIGDTCSIEDQVMGACAKTYRNDYVFATAYKASCP